MATVDGIPLIALGWRDKTLTTFVASCGTTDEGEPHKKRRRRAFDGFKSETYFRSVKRPKLVEQYFASAQKIDVHNHLRQGSLRLEVAWGTHKWEHRVMSTLLGIIEVDSFLAFQLVHPDGAGVTHRQFTEQLALQLIHNRHGELSAPLTRNAPTTSVARYVGDTHTIFSLTTLPQYDHRKGCAGGARRKCVVCSFVFSEQNNAHYYCKECSDPSKGYIITLCGERSCRGSRCLDWHRQHGIPDCFQKN